MSLSHTTRALARLLGIQTAYRDVTGVVYPAKPEVIEVVARALDPVGGSPEELVDRRRRARATRVLPPVVVAWDGFAPPVPLTLPEDLHLPEIPVRVFLETGEILERRIAIDRLPVVRRITVGGRAHVRRLLPLPLDLPVGYHELLVETGHNLAPTLILSAPMSAFDHRQGDGGPHRWGVFAPLFALHSRRSWGIGDYTDLDRLSRWTSRLGGDIVGTLPLLPLFLDEPFAPSPYAPISREFWSELYIDVTRVPEFDGARSAHTDGFNAELDALRDSPHVGYREVMRLKRRALEDMARTFFATPSRRRDAFERYAAAGPLESEFAAFRAATDRHRTGFRSWPETARHGLLDPSQYDESTWRYHRYAQWVAHEQMTRVATRAKRDGLGLYLDYPVGVHNDGFDVWRNRDLYTEGLAVGAPPDPLAPDGQNWGFPALVPDANRADHYRHVRAILSHHIAHSGVLRIDHVMGLHRLFVIPYGRPGADGVYIHYPHDELYAIACIESNRHDTVLLGEDLGTVAAGVRSAMHRHNVLRMHVVQGALWEGAAHAFNLPSPVVASVNTHDMSPFAAFWTGSDIDVRHSLGLLPDDLVDVEREQRVHLRREMRNHLKRPPADGTDDAFDALLDCQRLLAGSSADIQLVSLEDLWLEEIPLNVPGTNEEHPNWKRRFSRTFEDIRDDETILAALEEIDGIRRRGRPATTMKEVTVASETPRETPREVPRETQPVSSPPAPPLGALRLSDVDLHLFNEGTHARMYEKFGAHVATHESAGGVYFAVWAPNAANVSVIGEFNGWNPAASPLTLRGSSGVWDGFLRGVGAGSSYKYHVVSRDMFTGDKADPIGFRSEGAPSNASVVCTLDYTWSDESWMASRGEAHRPDRPVSAYELHLGSWKRSPSGGHLTYGEIADEPIPYLTDLGYTHVELMPVMEHPFYGSWGYQITGYFAATHRYGSPQELMSFIDRLHQAGIGVLLDWVPSHFPTDGHGLAFFDGTHLYEHADPQKGFHPDWNSYIFNYGRHEVRSYLISNAMFWLDRFHIDGLRVDAVASMLYLDYSREEGEWVPNEHGGRDNLEAISLLKEELNHHLHDAFPDTMQVAEESTAWPMVTGDLSAGGLGFAYKWDMGWMHDTLDYFERDPVHRAHHHDRITFRGVYANTERFMLSLSHDEVVHGKRSLLSKMPGDWWQQFANLRLLFGYMYTLPGKKLHFMGCEFGVWNEWDHDDQLDWALTAQPMHAAMQAWIRALNRLYREVPSLHDRDHHPEGFEWIDCHDREASVLSFARWSGDEANAPTLVVCNFTPVVRSDFRVGVPREGTWELILNGDDESFGGGGVQPADASAIDSEPIEANGREHSLMLTLPPLATMFFRGPIRTAT